MSTKVVVCQEELGPGLVDRVASAVSDGKIIVCPTDTLYALVADAKNSIAMDRIYVIKGRSITQSLPLIAADLEQVNEQIGALSDLGTRLASTFWPGPLTLIVQAHAVLGDQCKATDGSVAVRVPNQSFARAVARQVGHPVTATSANCSGDAAISRIEDLTEDIKQGVDLIVNAGSLVGGTPSTIVDVRYTTPILIRSGAVPWDRVLESLQ
ncbi:MAG TPA: threonylcarbamoyl-AMP synthase [Acidobacteria bacterium]|jgi:L-threonylcarbamoyladenylate synthase|nr:threonylcarbamoyl-AMP synthase [Acidobacteriota bacterium]